MRTPVDAPEPPPLAVQPPWITLFSTDVPVEPSHTPTESFDAPRLQVWLRLCDLGLQHVFDAVVTFEDTGERKPAAAPFREVLRRLGVEPAESMMIGDWAERDVVGAKGLGMRTVFARYGDTFDTKESGADHDVDDVFDLVGIVDRLNGRPPAVAAHGKGTQGGGVNVR